MKKRPLSVTILGSIYIVTGVAGIAVHITEFNPRHPFEADAILAFGVRLLAILCGVFMLRGANWARWLAVAWIAYHVVLSSFFSLRAAVLHAVLCAVFTYFLFRPEANAYFRRPRAEQVSS